jgi:hypothetical protein
MGVNKRSLLLANFEKYMWKQWLNLLFGLWVIASAYMGFTADTMATNLTISGIVIAGLSLWAALEQGRMGERSMSTDEMRRHA